jgi:hypothetical protein
MKEFAGLISYTIFCQILNMYLRGPVRIWIKIYLNPNLRVR